MRLFPLPTAVILLAGFCTAAVLESQGARAATYSEAVNGDLSGVVTAPTVWGALDVGANSVTATFGGGDFDLLAFTIGAGNHLDSLTLNNYTGLSRSFTSLQAGTVWTAGLGSAVNASKLLGWTHITGSLIGTDILDNLSSAAGAIGFTPPLGAGNYIFEMQDTGGAVSGAFTFNVTGPPPPMLVGDANQDCTVGAADYAIWAAQFGQTAAGLSADFDGNGSVGAGDYALWAANFGNTCSPATATVPEPGGWVLAASGLGSLFSARRKRRARGSQIAER